MLRAFLALVLAAGLSGCSGCGDESGILVTVSQDDTVTQPVETLHFIIGVLDPATGDYVRDDFGAETMIDVADRDLATDPYKLLLRDAGAGQDPTSIVVGVIGESGGVPVAFAGMSAPMTFRDGSVLEIELTLAGDSSGLTSTATGCLTWAGGAVTVVSPSDRDCNGCDDATGAGCAGECQQAADCMAANGAPPCGAWECNAGSCDVVCPDCADADGDGYGVGTGCAGADCDDADDALIDGSTASCYSADSSTLGVGVCQAGSHTCRGGTWTPCSGEVIPGGEGCNLEDDDCDGSVDEDLSTITCGVGACVATGPACTGGVPGACTPGTPAADDSSCDGIDSDCVGSVDEDCPCVLVAPAGDGGSDSGAVADDNVTPFATVQAAIDWAAADSSRPNVVCLATCGTVSSTYSGAITMADGISVDGGYDLARARCGTSATLATGTATGVLFPDTVQSPTNLSRVIISRFNSGVAGTTAGVTVDGATGVTLSFVDITSAPTVATSWGVNLISGASALITRSRIDGGGGTAEAIGVRSIQSTPTIFDNCSGYDNAGRCNFWCDESWIQGRTVNGAGVVHAVYLEDSPGAQVDTNSLCAINGARGAVVEITGAAAGTSVRRNWVDAWGATGESNGILADDCAGDSPQVTDNAGLWAAGDLATTVVRTVSALGDCHPVIDGNLLIRGASEGGTAATTGVFCGTSSQTNVPSRCVVTDNPDIQSATAGVPPESTGIRCEDGGCMRIARNGISAHGAVRTNGIWLGRTGALVSDNDISGGCGTTSAFGVHAIASSARLDNNRIFAGFCENNTSVALFVGVDAVIEAGASELDVHSNHIDGRGAAAPCRSVGIRLSPGAVAPAAGSGKFKNNIVRAGLCSTSYAIEELTGGADPRELWNNDLAPNDSPTALYRDEGTTDWTQISDVNALTDTSAQANISADPLQVSYPTDLHLSSGSVCTDAGTPAGAPALDMDGDPRDATPDIGPDEL
ncbi:MAG TPA: hypothetical protein VL172_22135 [Kofleriaceae bacterium]|nr:hypothetical protein [Kofleriaceae bacterium]